MTRLDHAKASSADRVRAAKSAEQLLADTRREQGYSVFASRKNGTCRACRTAIAKGELIAWRRGRSNAYHLRCNPQPWSPAAPRSRAERLAARTTPDVVKGGPAEDR